MSYVEKYVSVAGSGAHDGSSEANAWTWDEMVANRVVKDRANIIAGSYSVSGGAMTTVGSMTNRFIIRGYNTVIGDLEGQGRNSDGSLNTTNFPVVTVSASFSPGSFDIIQNIFFTGAFAGTIFNVAGSDEISMIESKVENTLSSSSAEAGEGDNRCLFINSDFVCSGATHGLVLQSDGDSTFTGCRIEGKSSSSAFLDTRSLIMDGCSVVNIGTAGTSKGLFINAIGNYYFVKNNTFYNFGTAIQTINSTQGNGVYLFLNNHYTDCAKGLDSLYSATADVFAIEMNSRTRDNTTPRTGFGDSLNIAEVTTDTGGPETDYVDAPNGDITLIAAAPAVDSGLGM